ncbi:MAG: hypothetical protein GY777_31240 [Candidatus Brocadiaceae bacterium]|nr:hypothetical protein [Candidatus Brocadiaceae bacterium]
MIKKEGVKAADDLTASFHAETLPRLSAGLPASLLGWVCQEGTEAPPPVPNGTFGQGGQEEKK